MPFTINEHRHRSCVWGAARSSTVKGCRFSVKNAREILEASGFNANFIASPDNLPSSKKIDTAHSEWRKKIIAQAKIYAPHLNFTPGVAAKLINTYLKAAFVCGGHHNHKLVCSLHPPIDRLLLKELSDQNIGGLGSFWKSMYSIGWSKFNSEEYVNVITNIRQVMSGQPLWKIEQYWRGHQ